MPSVISQTLNANFSIPEGFPKVAMRSLYRRVVSSGDLGV